MELHQASQYRIGEDAIARICQNRSRHMNSEARLAGQPQRITATDLEDLYYKQGGMCAICGTPVEDHGPHKHPKAIRADHIRNVNRRSTFESRACGSISTGALIADIGNVQWVCHLCNTLKQIVVASGVQWAEYVAGCNAQASMGFPLRSDAVVCGSRMSRRHSRMDWMRQQFESHGHALSSRDVAKHFAHTDLEANYATYLKELKEIGWCGQRHASELRKQVAEQLCRASTTADEKTLKEWCEAFNVAVHDQHCLPAVSVVRFRQIIDEHALTFPIAERVDGKAKIRMASSAEKAWMLDELRLAGPNGMTRKDLVEKTKSATFAAELKAEAIEQLIQSGRIEEHDGRLFYGLTRREAAEVIGVSPHRLKKWAVYGTGPRFMKTPNNSKGDCYYSARMLYEFAENRTKTPCDASRQPCQPQAANGSCA
jgi:hypothetical protein